ncbi:tyrosine-protein kinase family protein [Cutibacterium avidum]|uniref:tyrosine-protein kinase family protein n=1 Tax=Cutibacterium avidum TaxID=33010 RepID=UPI002017F89E|nr:hypothetical protein [Cutibacterium avidum]
MALAGNDVILIDADLRRPKVQKNFDLDDGLGLPEVLIGAAPLDQALRTTPTTGLSVLPCTDTPRTPPNCWVRSTCPNCCRSWHKTTSSSWMPRQCCPSLTP